MLSTKKRQLRVMNMVIARTPYRISFFGGGSDFKNYYETRGGAVLSATIDKYCYVTTRRMPQFFGYNSQFTYSKIERFNTADEVEHPLVRNALKMLNTQNIQIAYDSDLPARSGIGSSSAFAVGLLNGLRTLEGVSPTKKELAQQAIYLERELCNEAGGIQDQISTAYGGINKISFSSDGFEVNQIKFPTERKLALNGNLLLFFTGFQRNSYDISQKQDSRTGQNIAVLDEMVELVDAGVSILTEGDDLNDFGRLLDYSWKLKKSLADEITTDEINAMYEKAKRAGALGGKLLGAGGGGFMLLYVEPYKQQSVKNALSDFLQIPFRFESSGTSIIYKGSGD